MESTDSTHHRQGEGEISINLNAMPLGITGEDRLAAAERLEREREREAFLRESQQHESGYWRKRWCDGK